MIGHAPASLRILIVDDDANIRKMLATSLETDGHQAITVGNAADAVAEASRRHFDVALVDLHLKVSSGLNLIPRLLAQSPWIRVVVITGFASVDTAVEAMKRGAVDYLTKPFTPAQVKRVTQWLARQIALKQHPALDENGAQSPGTLESESPVMQRVISLARQVADSNSTIVMRGESGTGKGVLARLIHQWSARHGKPFATVSCPSLSSQLLESELFGHVKGAFTSAVRDNPGRIANSEGGTLFLDEIGDLPL
jgi:NtrC-family two-component system response regulator AlgB